MERRITHGDMKRIAWFDHTPKDILALFLLFERDVQFVLLANLLCRFERARVYIDTSEIPAVLTLAN